MTREIPPSVTSEATKIAYNEGFHDAAHMALNIVAEEIEDPQNLQETINAIIHRVTELANT